MRFLSQRTRLGLAVLALAACLPSTALAQGETGFTRGQGKTDVVLAWVLDRYDHFWVGDKKVKMAGVGTVERTSYVLYAAHGLTDDLDLVINAAWVEAESSGSGGFPDESDPQDFAAYAKWRVGAWRAGPGEFSFLLEPGIKVPMSDYQDNSVTAIGDGQVDFRGRVIGHWRADNGFFTSLETGYDVRDGAPHDEVPVNLTLGYTLADRLTLMPFYSRVDSLGGSNIGAPGGFPSNEEEYQRVGLGLYWRIDDRFGLTAGYRTTLDGKNTGDVEGYSFGLVLRF